MNDNLYTGEIEIASGMTVYDSAGDKVGTIHNYDDQNGYLDVRKGWLFPKDIYVPVGMVDQVTPDGIFLRTTSDQLQNGDYDRAAYDQPATTQTTAYAADTTVPAGTAAGTAYGTTDQPLTQGEDVRVPVYEENLVVGKRREEEGRVHIHKDVVEEPETATAQLQHERVTVERVPLSGGAATDDAFEDRDIDIPVYGEEVVVGKQTRGVEEVRLHKDVVTENEQITETVRKERVEVDGVDTDDVTTADRTTPRTRR